MLKFLLLALASTCCILGVGCASSHPFRPTAAHLEYWVEEDMGPNSFRIYYQGGGPSSEERIVDFALLRACHLAEEWDCKYFAVVNEVLSNEERRVYDSDVESIALQRNDRLVIKCFSSRPKGVFVFHAKATEESIRRKYRPGDNKARS
jgi:hypothetical protein